MHRSTPSSPRWTARWICGPDAGGSTLLHHGRQLVGRDHRVAVRCDDRALLARHAVLHVTDAGVLASPWRGDGDVLLDGVAVSEPTAAPHGAHIDVGCSRLRIESSTLVDDGTWASRGSLTPGTLAAATASVVAVRLGLPALGVAAAIGLAVTVASWALQALVERRTRRPIIGIGTGSMRPVSLPSRRLRVALVGPHAVAVARSLVLQLLELDPGHRVTIAATVAHPWAWCARFAEIHLDVPHPASRPAPATTTLVTDAATAVLLRRGRRTRHLQLVGVGERAAVQRAAAIDASRDRQRPSRRSRRKSEIILR